MKRFLAAGTVVSIITSLSAVELQFDFDPTDENALPAAITKAVSKAYDKNKQGLEALDNKQYDVALALFDEALRILPDYSDAENNRGVAYFRRGNIGDARRIWETLAARDPKYATASYNLGLVYLHERQLEAALRLFERAVKANGRFVEALVRCGTTLLEMGRKDKGLEYLNKAYRIAPTHPDSWSFLAFGLISAGDTVEAIRILRKNESDVKALRLLGSLESARKNGGKAAQYFTDAVAKGADPSILVELASSQAESGNCKEALATLQNYFARNIPHTADAYLTGGIAAKECGRIDEAQKYFEEGVRRHPKDPILSYNLGQIYFHQKKYDRAEETWDGLSDSVQDPSLLYLRALNARRRNDFKNARRIIQRALSMDNRAEFHDFLGVIYHQESNDKRAEEEFRRALSINPELRSAQLNLALLSRKGEDLGAAAGALRQQLSACSGDDCPTLAFQLAILYYHRKMIDKAVGVLLGVKESDKDERIYRHLALFYRELQEWNKAIAALETAAKSFVLELQTEYELAETYLLAGRHAKAVERFDALIPKWHENPWRLYYQMGYAWLERNNLEQAQRCFEKSIKSKSDNVAARGLLAFVLNRKGKITEARSLWEKNLRDDPSNPALWINMGLSLEREKRFGEALEHYKKAEALKPGEKEIQINIGNAYNGMGRYTDAINAYQGALGSSKRNLAAYNIFLAAIKKKDKERAGKMLSLLEKEFSGSPYAQRSRAEMSLWNGDTAGAKRTLEALADKEEADWLALARIHAVRGSTQKARECLAKLPDDASWKTEIAAVEAQIAFSQGDFTKAMRLMRDAGDTAFAAQYNIALTAYHAKQFRQALDIARRLSGKATGRDRADVCRLAGNAAFSLKQWDDARQWYLQLSSVDANNAVVQYNLAVAHYNLGRIEDSWKYYQRAKGYDQSIYNKDIEARYRRKKGVAAADSISVLDSADVWYNRAVELQRAGSDSAAEKLYKKVVAKDAGNSLAWNNLGAIYGKRGDIDNTEKAYFKAIEKRHDIPETYANLINLYIELEEFAKARKWTIKGMGHNPDSEVLGGMREKIEAAEEAVKKRKAQEATGEDVRE
ncbi:MAG: tetratricopeptide repeat protein [Chitinispirillaceae bacterium]|nr:tetratricopeptide repeat protein [Chitinispirillaceae bacterium]